MVYMDLHDYTAQYLQETNKIADLIDQNEIIKAIELLSELKKSGGRLFILGVGGSAANASHAVNDFRKIAGIEAYAPTDNVAELTARTNDEGWNTTFSKWLETSRLNANDALLILSVGGGSLTTSLNIKEAIDYAVEKKAGVTAIVSRDGGYAKRKADACVLVPVVSDSRITPHAEGWQGVVWHLIVNAIGMLNIEKIGEKYE
jgi:D-sedoheptulose 7-phosphate isomerase